MLGWLKQGIEKYDKKNWQENQEPGPNTIKAS